MSASDNIKLLEESLNQAREAANHLRISVDRCIPFLSATPYSEEQLIELEALTSRFARLSDILIQKVLKTIERLDRDSPGTVRDRILQAEKKGVIQSASVLLEIRDVRNAITHDYENSTFFEIVLFAVKTSPALLKDIENAFEYCKRFN